MKKILITITILLLISSYAHAQTFITSRTVGENYSDKITLDSDGNITLGFLYYCISFKKKDIPKYKEVFKDFLYGKREPGTSHKISRIKIDDKSSYEFMTVFSKQKILILTLRYRSKSINLMRLNYINITTYLELLSKIPEMEQELIDMKNNHDYMFED